MFLEIKFELEKKYRSFIEATTVTRRGGTMAMTFHPLISDGLHPCIARFLFRGCIKGIFRKLFVE